jgi:hypothetical protein
VFRFVAAVALGAAASSLPSLDVPYLPQTEALCGGASAAMVMRYWGERDVYPDEFAPLVDRSAGGIRTSALAAALEGRGWVAAAGPGDLAQLAREVERGRPVIALIEDRPGRYHYVVVVSVAGGAVVLHDPARAPSRRLDADAFDAAWSKAGRWMLILLPPPGGVPKPAPAERREARHAVRPCPAVDRGVALAASGDTREARRALEASIAACPDASAPWRELAGLDALEGNWRDAAARAQRAVDIEEGDAHAWRVLATARFVLRDDRAALDAWNRIGEPRADIVDITGLRRTRYLAVSDAIGVEARQLLTAGALRLAERRVRDLPAVAAARVTYRPTGDGRAQVDASIVERDAAPATPVSWLAIGAGALANREAAGTFANVSGGGDAAAVTWRWWEGRPMIGASYAAPGPWGIWTVGASRETQTFGPRDVEPTEETRTRTGVEIGSWIDERTRIAGGAALERWSGRGRAAAFGAAVVYWPLVDRLALEARATAWRGGAGPFSASAVTARFRSTPAQAGSVWLLDAGYRAASDSSPASVWPGADTGRARDVLLRAHPLLDAGVVTGGVFGRRVASAGIELQQWLAPGRRLLRVAPAAFVDLARATRGLPATDSRLHADAGAGLRISIFGAGVVRIDVAHGLRDGRNALSIGWQR